ncbi:hypothetical protein FSP39_008782 [Pinctada imbricata]|uniref:G-protein coupled receptors family 1 profile domain-containing protein n=1 Tax=Pinctada imbricata TaxID=66713 RepID=A0AA88XYL9_PINIB|nr:hypothetical protein FSP39_008782 [Pinctada imbricata]
MVIETTCLKVKRSNEIEKSCRYTTSFNPALESGHFGILAVAEYAVIFIRKSPVLFDHLDKPSLMSTIQRTNVTQDSFIQLIENATEVSTYIWNYSELQLNSSNASWSNTSEETSVHFTHPAISALLVFFSVVTIVGNLLVIIAVSKELYLRTVTNYFIVSLAVADLIIGGIVMPFSISLELTNQVWLFGSEWCDLWHSFDVLASTASILNLCVISLDRYWAITDPIAYPTKMSTCKVSLLIAFVWLCSAGISFPAIAWWKAVMPNNLPPHLCIFTEDSAYLIFSSTVSFYCPTVIMMFVYWRIYLAAMAQIKSLKTGSKTLTSNGIHGVREVMTLRIHRGGGGGGVSRQPSDEYAQTYEKCATDSDHEILVNNKRIHTADANNHRPAKFITKRLRQFALSKKITKLAREQKAAKTLGIVVGVFIMCWVPFFVLNILIGTCNDSCVSNKGLLFPLFTWLGYINSGMNPVIYALSMKDFRRAFGKIVFVCCPRYKFSYQRAYKKKNGSSTSSFMVANCTSAHDKH